MIEPTLVSANVRPLFAATQGKIVIAPGGLSVGICMLICSTPQGRVGALPAYRTGPPNSKIAAKPLMIFAGPGTFNPPVGHAGSVAPKPVPSSTITEPRAAGFNGPLKVPSWFRAQ